MSQANQFSAMIAARAAEMSRRQDLGGAGLPKTAPALRPHQRWAARLMMPGALIGVVATMYVGRILANLLD